MISLQDKWATEFSPLGEDGIYGQIEEGYWSNLTINENKALVESLSHLSPRQAIRQFHPHYEDIIFSSKRAAGIELLEPTGDEICIDYGCMWGALTIPLAKRTKAVMGVDKTRPSLQFLKAYAQESGCDNITLINKELQTFPKLQNPVDIAMVNGVLEWVPEIGNIELRSYYQTPEKRTYSTHPGKIQEQFLRRVNENLKPGGKLYLAIENRYAYSMFFGTPDPHNGLRFTTILPRYLASVVSKIKLRRPYVNWLYSPLSLKKLLRRVGFNQIDLYSCFPDYRFPQSIIPFSHSMNRYIPFFPDTPKTAWGKFRRTIKSKMEILLFRKFSLHTFSPSIIAVAKK